MNAYDNLEIAEDKAEARDLAILTALIVDWAGGPNTLSFEDALVTAWKHFEQAAAFAAEQGTAPILDSITPASLDVPGVDSEIVLNGSGFNEQSTINWNGGDETTDFISATELRTSVKPSTVQAPLPFTLPVYVHHSGLQSNILEFTFTQRAR